MRSKPFLTARPKARRDGVHLGAVGIGGADDMGYAIQRCGAQIKQVEHRIKGAKVAFMGQRDIGDIKRRGRVAISDTCNPFRADEHEFRVRINETAD